MKSSGQIRARINELYIRARDAGYISEDSRKAATPWRGFPQRNPGHRHHLALL
jgi:hypothetical protein